MIYKRGSVTEKDNLEYVLRKLAEYEGWSYSSKEGGEINSDGPFNAKFNGNSRYVSCHFYPHLWGRNYHQSFDAIAPVVKKVFSSIEEYKKENPFAFGDLMYNRLSDALVQGYIENNTNIIMCALVDIIEKLEIHG